MLERMWRKKNHYLLPVGIQIHRTIMEICLEVPQNILDRANMGQLFCCWDIPENPMSYHLHFADLGILKNFKIRDWLFAFLSFGKLPILFICPFDDWQFYFLDIQFLQFFVNSPLAPVWSGAGKDCRPFCEPPMLTVNSVGCFLLHMLIFLFPQSCSCWYLGLTHRL